MNNSKKSILIVYIFSFLLINFFGSFGVLKVYTQSLYNQNNFPTNPQNNNYAANLAAFKQEIARMEINVIRSGQQPLSITQVPRLEKDDILKVRLLEEPVNSLKPDQSNFDWTFVVAFINPGRNSDSDKTVSEEINFRKRGWYKEHTFIVPYDCQPIFFLYPKSQYRSKILNLINKNQDVIQKIGEKTIEIADAYAKIGMFLTELQDVVNRNYYRGIYNNLGFGNFGIYGNNSRNFGYNDSFIAEQAIERIARSFNIQLPNCWGASQYNPYGNSNPYNNNVYNTYNQFGTSNDLVGRVQCVARTVRIEDFDISISKMIQQGGIFAAAQLTQKYPQIAFWINIAAAALDFIIKVTGRAPLKIIPTFTSFNETPTNPYMQSMQNNTLTPNIVPNSASQANSTKIALFAESPPNNSGFVTAYPMVFHKWQANADPNLIELPMPVLMDSCLHTGQNIIRTTDIINDWMNDKFTKEFQFTLFSNSGYKKDFPLKKNVGFGGWELSLTKEELGTIPKVNLEAKITGKRGFNKIQSPNFKVSLSSAGNWVVEKNSQKSLTVGGKRTITLQNQNGDCRCLELVVYKSPWGKEILFDSKKLVYSPDGEEVSFELDATSQTSGAGKLELKQYGGDSYNLDLNLYPASPNITDVKVSKGDNKIVIIGERLDQVQSVRINGKRAITTNSENKINQPISSVPTNNMYTNSASDREKTFVFENPGQLQDSNSFSLELELTDQRIISSPNIFNVGAARPVISTKETKEVEGFVLSASKATIGNSKNKTEDSLINLFTFPLDTSKIGVNIQNSLTDYDFTTGNLRIETRIENTENNPFLETDIDFEVFDWRSMQLNIRLSDQAKKVLGGRRLQFRICDAKRGDSDWYSIKQVFVRIPKISSIKCSGKDCVLIGEGLNYIQRISLDDGKTWLPEGKELIPSSIENGLESLTIPNSSLAKKTLKIILKDFPKVEGQIAVRLD